MVWFENYDALYDILEAIRMFIFRIILQLFTGTRGFVTVKLVNFPENTFNFQHFKQSKSYITHLCILKQSCGK